MKKRYIVKKIISATDVGLFRKQNEDFCEFTETLNGTLCVVCDGMGGHVGGIEASRIAVNCIVQYFCKETYSDIQKALKGALDFANLQIIGSAMENPELKGMGTTACILLLQDNCAWIAHVGDSRIYLYVSKKKRLHRLTKDHSYVQGLVDQGIIYEEEAENHPDKNRILKALGIKEDLLPDIAEKPILPAKGDIFLICTDGLSGMVPDKQVQAILSQKSSLQEKEAALMAAAKTAGGLDNITLQLVQISQSTHKKSVFEDKSAAVLPKTTKKQNLLKITLLLMGAIGILSVGFFMGRKGDSIQTEIPIIPNDSIPITNQNDSISNQDETLFMPSDSIIIEDQAEQISDDDTIQIAPIVQKIDSII